MKINKKLFLLAIFLITTYSAATYNSIITEKNHIDASWAQIETQYQRRYDLIPNLIKSTQGIMKHEKDIFESVNHAREHYATSQSKEKKMESTKELDQVMTRFFAVAESYPEIKSDKAFLALMDKEFADDVLILKNMKYSLQRTFSEKMGEVNSEMKDVLVWCLNLCRKYHDKFDFNTQEDIIYFAIMFGHNMESFEKTFEIRDSSFREEVVQWTKNLVHRYPLKEASTYAHFALYLSTNGVKKEEVIKVLDKGLALDPKNQECLKMKRSIDSF